MPTRVGIVSGEFVAEPLGKTPPRPVPPWAARRLNWFRFAGASGGVNPNPLATEFRRHRAGIVDSDVAFKLRHEGFPRWVSCLSRGCRTYAFRSHARPDLDFSTVTKILSSVSDR